LGGAVISVRPEVQYLEFSFAVSVQGWRTKWFYIQDRKASPEDQYGLATFDASKEVKKLASWDALPSDAEIAQVLPLLCNAPPFAKGRTPVLMCHSLDQ
jgi:hypothetical protein